MGTTRSYACTTQAVLTRLGSNVRRTSRILLAWCCRRATLLSLLPWCRVLESLPDLERCPEEPVPIAGAQLCPWNTRRKLYQHVGNFVGSVVSPLLCNIFLHQLDKYMESLGANRVQTKQEANLRRSTAYRKVDNAICRARRKLRGNPDRQARRELLDKLDTLEKEMRYTPMYETRHHTKLGYTRYADDWVILVNGTKEEAIDLKNKVEGHLAARGLTLSEEKTSITHWEKPMTFLGYHIHGVQRRHGVQIKAMLSIPEEKERALRRELVRVASYHHIPEVDAMLSMSAKFRGWCNYYKYANNPQVIFQRIAHKMWWFYAHFLARKHKSSIKPLLIKAKKNGSHRVITKGTSKQGTFTIELNKGKRIYLDVFPPKSEEIRRVGNKETWTVDLKPVNPDGWLRGRSAATRLSALTRSGGRCERCGENPATQIHHKNRMKARRTMPAKVVSDRDQRDRARALCKECHLEAHHGTWQG